MILCNYLIKRYDVFSFVIEDYYDYCELFVVVVIGLSRLFDNIRNIFVVSIIEVSIQLPFLIGEH